MSESCVLYRGVFVSSDLQGTGSDQFQLGDGVYLIVVQVEIPQPVRTSKL